MENLNVDLPKNPRNDEEGN